MLNKRDANCINVIDLDIFLSIYTVFSVFLCLCRFDIEISYMQYEIHVYEM